jgi:hypothetical protein
VSVDDVAGGSGLAKSKPTSRTEAAIDVLVDANRDAETVRPALSTTGFFGRAGQALDQ